MTELNFAIKKCVGDQVIRNDAQTAFEWAANLRVVLSHATRRLLSWSQHCYRISPECNVCDAYTKDLEAGHEIQKDHLDDPAFWGENLQKAMQ